MNSTSDEKTYLLKKLQMIIFNLLILKRKRKQKGKELGTQKIDIVKK